MEPLSRRKYDRIPFSTTLEIVEVDTGHRIPGRSIDLSRGGVGFYAERFIPAGTRIRVNLDLPAGYRPATVWLSATVMRATSEGAGGIMGAQFDSPLSPVSQPALCEMVDSR